MLTVEGVLNTKALVRDATDDNTTVVITAIFVPRAADENIGHPKSTMAPIARGRHRCHKISRIILTASPRGTSALTLGCATGATPVSLQIRDAVPLRTYYLSFLNSGGFHNKLREQVISQTRDWGMRFGSI